jgi:hypothetical protein
MFSQNLTKQKKHITKNGKYFISTNDTWDKGWETMVFKYDISNSSVLIGANLTLSIITIRMRLMLVTIR